MKKKTGRSEYAYRLVVDKWPTPDGRPFAEQPLEYWERIVAAYHNRTGGYSYPEWLPADIGPWLADGNDSPSRPGHPIFDETGHLLNVPAVPRHRRSLTRPTAARRAEDLMDWGCSVRIERALLGEWTTA